MALPEKLPWYRNRLASMSVPEIAWRLRQAAGRRLCRRRKPLQPIPDALLPRIPGLREQLAFWSTSPALLQQWREQLEQARAGRFFLLNMPWPDCPRGRRWHLDPATGKSWPHDRYCFDIDYRHAREMGDIKYAWELGRLQYLQHLAALAFKQDDPDAAAFTLGELEDWIDHNPPYSGIGWASGIELALRAVSILIVTTLVGEHASDAQRRKIWDTLDAHAAWLRRFPSRFSSANNHLVAEGLGLFAIGKLCPQLRESERDRAYGWHILCTESQKQILPDGVGAEQAAGYTAVVAEMLLLGLLIARTCGMKPPEHYTERLALTGEWLRWLTDEGGNQPRIGDDDEACVIGCWQKNRHYARSVLGCLAAMLNRPDLTPSHAEPQLRNGFFGMPSAPVPATAPSGTRTFRDGGYTVFRHGGKLLAFDHGPLGYLSIAAHGHADALALWLHIGDQPVLVDAGTWLYHSGGRKRDDFRGTAAHNTLYLEAADASMVSGSFSWSHKARVTLLSADEHHAEAEHDGYLKRFGAIHRRRVDVDETGFSVTDSIAAPAERRAEIRFLLHPLLRAEQRQGEIAVIRDKRRLLRITHESPLAATIEQGWYSSAFGRKQPASRIIFAGMLAPGRKAVTRFSYAGD